MELQRLERERVRRYKQQLKEQIEKKEKQRKVENDYEQKKKNIDQNELIEHLKSGDLYRMEERKNNQMLMKEQNAEMSVLKKSLSQNEDGMIGEQRGNSFTDTIYKKDLERLQRQREGHRYQDEQNLMTKHWKRQNEDSARSQQKLEEIKHVERIKEQAAESRRNYENIKNKHTQNMQLYNMHSQLMQENEQYRKLAEKFTDCNEDILSNLYRDQYSQRRRDYKLTQETLMSQMEEFREKKDIEKSQILEGAEMEKSMLKALLHSKPNNKKAYAEDLKGQMWERDTRNSQQIKSLKEKYHVGGIFGGEQGRQRKYQIDYIDKRLGISTSGNPPNVQEPQLANQKYKLKANDRPGQAQETPRERKASSLGMNVINMQSNYREPIPNDMATPKYAPKTNYLPAEQDPRHAFRAPSGLSNLPQIPRQNSLVQPQRYEQSYHNPVFTPRNSYQEQNQQRSGGQSPQQQHRDIPPASPAQQIRESPRLGQRQGSPTEWQGPNSTERQGPNSAERQGPNSAEERRVFRSFDLVTGRSRYYC